jgi:soluble lytic murein transglycosylase-like protein
MKIKRILGLAITLASLVFCPAVFANTVNICLNSIALIESSNNSEAYNVRSKARGLYQITPICLADYNQYHRDKITAEQLFLPEYNYKVANWYLNKRIPQLLRHYKQEDNLRNRLISYNAGVNYVITKQELPQETKDYLRKYDRAIIGQY